MEALKQQPDEFYFFYQFRIKKLSDVIPNQGHQALTTLQQKEHMVVITQNVDGLHQQANTKNVIELHGSLRTVRCLTCSAVYKTDRDRVL